MQSTDGYARMSMALLHEMLDDLKHTRRFIYVNQQESDLDTLDIATVKTLSGLTIDEIKALAQKEWVEYRINVSQLQRFIRQIIHSRSKDELIDQAITLGASRTMLRQMVKLPFHEFSRRREALALFDFPKKPLRLSEDELQTLMNLHFEYSNAHRMNGKIEHLRTLIYLSQQSEMSINRIYRYYYIEYTEFFSKQD